MIISDLRNVDPIYCGNRFLVCALWPEQRCSIWIVNGLHNQNCIFACGRSILNRTARTNIGALMRRYGGGGHEAAGTCQVPHEAAETTLRGIIDAINREEETPLAEAA